MQQTGSMLLQKMADGHLKVIGPTISLLSPQKKYFYNATRKEQWEKNGRRDEQKLLQSIYMYMHICVVNKSMEKCSASLIFREMQIQTTISYHRDWYTSKRAEVACVGRNVEMRHPWHPCFESQ